MKKLIVTIICVLFASTSFAQMVGASSIAKQSTPKTTLGVKKHEFSIHGGGGYVEEHGFFGHSIGLKYKYKPFNNFDIRILFEVGSEAAYLYHDYSPIFPILTGLNYEYRFNNNLNMFVDLGVGINLVHDSYRTGVWSSYNNNNRIDTRKYEIGFTISPEIGFVYEDFIFSLKYSYSRNGFFGSYYYTFYPYEDYYYEGIDESYELSLRLGYRF